MPNRFGVNSRKSQYWEGTGKIFCLREDLQQELRRFQGRRAPASAWCLASGRLVGTLSSNFSNVLCGVTLRRCAAQMSGVKIGGSRIWKDGRSKPPSPGNHDSHPETMTA
eukprot:scaffold20264_cov119-Isochrysis_galbana.AAC.1